MPNNFANMIALDRESLGWIKEESVFATEVKPATADQFLVAGEGSINQQLGFIEDAQRRNTYSETRRFAGRFNPGEASIPVYIKPAGDDANPDTPPEGSEFLKGAFGRESVSGGVSISYLLQRVTDILPTFTIWVKQGHFLYRCLGSIVNQARFPLRADNSAESLSQAAYSLLFAEMRWTGTDEANEVIGGTPQSTLDVTDARKFTVGSYIVVGSDDNSGAGFQVTAVDYENNVLTLSPDIADVSDEALITPWIPAAATEVGVPIHGRLGAATRGGVNLPILSGEIALDNQLKMLNEEKNGLDFANRFSRRAKRIVTVRAEIYFDANASRYFQDARTQVRGDIVFPWGTATGSKFTLTAKDVEFNNPGIGGTEDKIMTLEGRAFASSSLDDELSGLFN